MAIRQSKKILLIHARPSYHALDEAVVKSTGDRRWRDRPCAQAEFQTSHPTRPTVSGGPCCDNVARDGDERLQHVQQQLKTGSVSTRRRFSVDLLRHLPVSIVWNLQTPPSVHSVDPPDTPSVHSVDPPDTSQCPSVDPSSVQSRDPRRQLHRVVNPEVNHRQHS